MKPSLIKEVVLITIEVVLIILLLILTWFKYTHTYSPCIGWR